MKKLLALSVLFTMLAAAAFAQFKVEVDADIYPELMTVTAPIGDDADLEKSYQGSSTFDFLSKWGTWYDNTLRLKLSYTDPDGNYSGAIRFRGDSFVRPAGYIGFAGSGAVGFFENSGDNNGGGVTAVDLLTRHIDDYSLTGKLGPFSAYFGNGAARGKIDRFQQGFSNFQDKSKIDNYGLLKPTVDTGTNALTITAFDVNNLRRSASNANTTYVMGTVNLSPITISLAGSVFDVSPAPTGSFSWSRGNAGILLSGAGIADMLTFDLVYKVNGGDPDTDKKEKAGVATGPEPDGQGVWHNQLGIHANIKVPGVDALGLGIGYSGYFQVSENGKSGSDIQKRTNPLYSGIDLRFKLSGLLENKLTVTLNNNISFAGAKGVDTSSTKAVNGIRGALSSANEKESFFGLYNGLLIAYKFSDTFTGRAELANRLGSYTYTVSSNDAKSGLDILQIALSGAFTLNSHVGFEAGLALGVNSNSYETSNTDTSGGTLSFGIPLRMHIVF
jgi:hypothetical protein